MSSTPWPRVLVVTDRRRLVTATGVAAADWAEVLEAQVAGAVDGGADLVQVRERDLTARTLLAFLARLFTRWPQTRERVVVNDRADVAIAAGAAGVHLPSRGMSAADVRCLPGAGPGWVVGRSAHTPEDVTDPAGVSYWLVGTVQSSGSKPRGWTTLGWDGFTRVVRTAAPVPVVGIGGLTEVDVPRLVASGAAGMGGIECFLPGGGGDVETMVRRRVERVRRAFDTLAADPYTQGTNR